MTRVFFLLTFISCLAWAQTPTDNHAEAETSLEGARIARPEVIFPMKAEVSQRENVRLGDLAMVSRPTDELLGILDSLSLKVKEVVTASEISTLIKAEIESNEALRRINPAFKIPTEIQLHKSPAAISKLEVERRIINALQARCHDCEYKVNVQSAPFPANAQWELDLTQLSSKGSFLVPVRDGDTRATKWISGTVKVIKLTPVATRFIQVGERIQAEDLKMASVDVTFAKDSGLRLQDLQGQQLVRGVQMGQPIWAADVKREPATRKGQIVKATLGANDFEITTQLEAQDSGFVGDQIKVKNLETQKVLSALITDKGVVAIQ